MNIYKKYRDNNDEINQIRKVEFECINLGILMANRK